jgi:hypothetical protein
LNGAGSGDLTASYETATLRRRMDDQLEAMDRPPSSAAECSDSWVGKTTTVTTYPTTALAYYAVVPCYLGGSETEGTAVAVNAGTAAVMVANLGSAIPPVGTAVIVTRTGNRAVFRWDG